MTFFEKLHNAIQQNNSLLCIGLDPVEQFLPEELGESNTPFFSLNKTIIDQTHDLVCAYKPNSAFYEANGDRGIAELKTTCDYLRIMYPEIPIILDAKRGDIGSTNEGYTAYAFDYLQADAITLHPYLGQISLEPFLKRQEKGLFILCKTSNPGAEEFQNLSIEGTPLYQYVAKHVLDKWNGNKNCSFVIGATDTQAIADVRKLAPSLPFLIPGIGAQGGDMRSVLQTGLTAAKDGLIISISRDIIRAANIREAAQKKRDEINALR